MCELWTSMSLLSQSWGRSHRNRHGYRGVGGVKSNDLNLLVSKVSFGRGAGMSLTVRVAAPQMFSILTEAMWLAG